jgi:hypothetical protein
VSYAHTNRRGEGVTVGQERALFERMRDARAQEDHAYRSASGADVSGAPLYNGHAHFYQLLWEGVGIEDDATPCGARTRPRTTPRSTQHRRSSAGRPLGIR